MMSVTRNLLKQHITKSIALMNAVGLQQTSVPWKDIMRDEPSSLDPLGIALSAKKS